MTAFSAEFVAEVVFMAAPGAEEKELLSAIPAEFSASQIFRLALRALHLAGLHAHSGPQHPRTVF